MMRGGNTDVIVDPKEPHGNQMDTPIFVDSSEVCNERLRKKIVDLDRVKYKGFSPEE